MNDKKKNKKIRVLAAMSSGVDSSVSAVLLKEAGFDVLGVFMKLNNCSDNSEKSARLVAEKLDIPFYALNLKKEFKKEIIDYFLKEYKAGKTPNPCVVCNSKIKFYFLIKKALSLKADFIATGHYARIKNGNLLKGADKEKDQSYFLWKIDKKQLKKILFPIGGYKKSEVRDLAKKFNLPSAGKPESQEACFIEKETNDFLKKYLKTKQGNILDEKGKVLGKHNGLWFYTIGQRKGIGFSGGPYYVIAKDFKNNNLIVSKNEKELLKKELIAGSINWISDNPIPFKAEAKIRYRSKAVKASAYNYKKGKIKVVFSKPQKAITPGQSIVFYKGEKLLGGGIIE